MTCQVLRVNKDVGGKTLVAMMGAHPTPLARESISLFWTFNRVGQLHYGFDQPVQHCFNWVGQLYCQLGYLQPGMRGFLVWGGQHAPIYVNAWGLQIIDHGKIPFLEHLPNFLYPLQRVDFCPLGCIWFCKLLHLYVTSYLILWTIKFSLQQFFVAKILCLDK